VGEEIVVGTRIAVGGNGIGASVAVVALA